MVAIDFLSEGHQGILPGTHNESSPTHSTVGHGKTHRPCRSLDYHFLGHRADHEVVRMFPEGALSRNSMKRPIGGGFRISPFRLRFAQSGGCGLSAADA